jgi:hypothetical protein
MPEACANYPSLAKSRLEPSRARRPTVVTQARQFVMSQLTERRQVKDDFEIACAIEQPYGHPQGTSIQQIILVCDLG